MVRECFRGLFSRLANTSASLFLGSWNGAGKISGSGRVVFWLMLLVEACSWILLRILFRNRVINYVAHSLSQKSNLGIFSTFDCLVAFFVQFLSGCDCTQISANKTRNKTTIF